MTRKITYYGLLLSLFISVESAASAQLDSEPFDSTAKIQAEGIENKISVVSKSSQAANAAVTDAIAEDENTVAFSAPIAVDGFDATNFDLKKSMFPSQSTDTPKALQDQQFVGEMKNMVFGLLLVLAAIFGLSWLVKKLKLPMVPQQQQLEIISSISVGPKEKLILIRVENKKILIGVSSQSISLISELPGIESNDKSSLTRAEGFLPDIDDDGDFATKLGRMIKGV